MTCKKLIEYLSHFKQDEHVAFVVADPVKRLHYKISKCMLLDETPALLLETTETEPLDDIAEEAG